MTHEKLPAGWVRAPLADVVEVLDRFRVPINGEERAGRLGQVPYYGATGQVGWIDSHLFDEELVLLGEDGAPFLDPWKRKAYLIRGKAWVNNHAHVLRGTAVRNAFLMHQLNFIDYHGAVTGTTRLKLPQGPMRALELVVPPLVEQDRIVAEIDKQFTRLDAGVEALKRVQAQLKRYRASVLKAACEGRLVPTEAELARREKRDYEPADRLLARILKERRARWEADQLTKMKAAGKPPKDDKWKAKYVEPAPARLENLPSLPSGWTYASLIQLAFVASGNTPKGVEDKVAVAGEIPWLKVGDMNRPGNEKYLHGIDAWLSKDDVDALGMHVQPKGTIVFPKRGGAIATNKKRRLAAPSCYDLNCMGLIPLPIVSEFIWWWFSSINLATLSDGANIPQLNHGDIEPLVVPLPPINEQSRIVTEVEARLSVVEAAELAIASNETRAAHLRQAILKTAFEGALVPQDPRDEPALKLLERIASAVENNPLSKHRRVERTPAVPKKKATR